VGWQLVVGTSTNYWPLVKKFPDRSALRFARLVYEDGVKWDDAKEIMVGSVTIRAGAESKVISESVDYVNLTSS
jgi:hypothetical protein